MTTQNSINTPLSGTTGSGNFVGSTSPTISTPILKYANSGVIEDSNGNSLLGFTVTSSAVNYVATTNNSAGNTPQLNAVGSDTNIILVLTGKGNGGVEVQGTGTNNNSSAGFIGEFVDSVIALASAVSCTNNTSQNMTSISLSAGDWDVWGNITFSIGGTCTDIVGWISTTSATAPDASLYTGLQAAISIGSGTEQGFCVPQVRFSLSTTTTVYISSFTAFSTSTVTMCGGIYARRRR